MCITLITNSIKKFKNIPTNIHLKTFTEMRAPIKNELLSNIYD